MLSNTFATIILLRRRVFVAFHRALCRIKFSNASEDELFFL